ncbi:MAG: glycosyltransferase family 4 protein [Crocinitomicaceae bacterium]|nr:glycosyltransferase family 4 protein [Crocinitomicaceae bacterium]
MRILIVTTSTGWGGLEMNVIKLAKELQLKGIELHVVCQQGTSFSEKIHNQFEHIVQLKNVKKYFDFKNASILANYCKSKQISVAFTAYRPDLDLLAWTKRKVNNFKIIHQQQMQIGIPKKGFFQRLRFKAVDSWLTPLEWLKNEVIEKTIIHPSIIRIVPLGVRIAPFLEQLPDRKKAQSFFGFQSDAFVIGVLGRIDEKKGQLFLLKVLQKLVAKGEDIVLLIVGNPTIDDPKGIQYYEKMKQFITDNQLEDCVKFAPSTNEIMHFYSAIDLFVMSSEGETFGMVTVEAMFSKTPVIGTNTSGTPEVLGHGSRGVLYQFNNEQSFIDAYTTLRKKLTSKEIDLDVIQQEAMNLYSLDREVSGVLKAIDEVK